MTIAQIPELQEIREIQARTAAKRTEMRATIAANSKRLVKLQAEMEIESESETEPEEPAPPSITWLPFAMVAAIAATAGLWAGMLLTGRVT